MCDQWQLHNTKAKKLPLSSYTGWSYLFSYEQQQSYITSNLDNKNNKHYV